MKEADVARFVATFDAIDGDGIPVRARVRHVRGGVGGGVIEVDVPQGPGRSAAPPVVIRGLCPSGSVGCLLQSTCLLPPGAGEQSLMLECARARLKDFLRVGEDWQFFDDPAAQDAISQFDRARTAFTAAMLAGRGGDREAIALQSMELAVDAGERLASAYAVQTIERRSPKVLPTLGCVADLGESDANAIQAIVQQAKAEGATLRIGVPRSVVNRGATPDFTVVDRWVTAAFKSRVPILMGPLWECRDPAQAGLDAAALSDWVDAVVRRYGSGVAQWIVASDVERGHAGGASLESRLAITRRLSNQVRTLLPRAIVAIESTAPWGDRLDGRAGAPIVRTAMKLLDDSAPIHRLVVSLSASGHSPQRDLLQLAGILDSLRKVKVPLIVTLAVPSSMGAVAGGADAGWWRKPWSAAVADAYAARAVAVILSRPWVSGVCVDGTAGHASFAMVASHVQRVRRRLAKQSAAAGAERSSLPAAGDGAESSE